LPATPQAANLPADDQNTTTKTMGRPPMIDKIPAFVNADARLVHRGRFVDTTFMIAVDDDYTLVRIDAGRVTSVTHGPFITPNYSFALRAPRAVWDRFWQPLPPRGFTDVFALVKQKLMKVEGDLHPFMANLLYFKEVIAAPRKEAAQ
jgi:hypothetical protein